MNDPLGLLHTTKTEQLYCTEYLKHDMPITFLTAPRFYNFFRCLRSFKSPFFKYYDCVFIQGCKHSFVIIFLIHRADKTSYNECIK